MKMFKDKKGKWVAYHAPDGEEEYIFGETRKEIQDILNNKLCFCCSKKKCKYFLAEWYILKTKDLFEARNFGDILKGAGYENIEDL